MARMNWPFVGIPSFLRAPICTDLTELDADIAIMGVPFDEGVPFMPGSRFGPRSLREHFKCKLRRYATTGNRFFDPHTLHNQKVPMR